MVGGTATANPNNGRVVADQRFRLIAKPVVEGLGPARVFVCRDDLTEPANDCLNPDTGIYEKKITLEFYDIKNDPYENDALVREEMSRQQYKKFRKLCKELNKISKRATYFQNGKICNRNGEGLIDTDPLI